MARISSTSSASARCRYREPRRLLVIDTPVAAHGADVSFTQKASDRLSKSRSIRSWAHSARSSASSARSSTLKPSRSPRSMRSWATQFPNVPAFTPKDRATSAIGRSSSRTIDTASRRNSGGNFDGGPPLDFLIVDMDSSYTRCPSNGGIPIDRHQTEVVMTSAVESAMEIRPFHVDVPDEVLDDLRRRIGATRWPSEELVVDRSQGVQLATVQELARYWATDYDWRACEARLNALPQFKTEIDGVDIHFIHVKSPEADALPLIMTHGWPGSVIELLEVVGPLTDPTSHGGTPGDAFHLVLPSLPGYGFSGEP